MKILEKDELQNMLLGVGTLGTGGGGDSEFFGKPLVGAMNEVEQFLAYARAHN